MRWFCLMALLTGVSCTVSGQAAAKHPFAAEDWAALRSAHAVAVSAKDGKILYQVSFGDKKGPTHHEWWMIASDGSDAKKLELPEDFKPAGFTRQGDSFYGSYKINKQQQFAIFPVDANVSSAPSMLVLLPRGSGSAVPSPDGRRFALLADPRPPDGLAEVRDVIEPDQTGLYVVNADGTGGKWWCPGLKDISGGAPGGGGAGGAIWSADGATLAVLSATPKIGNHFVRSTIDVCNAEGARRVTEIANSVSGLAWAEGGKQIAFVSTKGNVLTPDHVWTVPMAGGAAVDRTPKLDASAVELTGDAQGRVWVLVNRGVRSEVDEFVFVQGALTTAYRWPAGTVSGVPVSPEFADGGHLAFTVSDPDHAANIAVAKDNALSKITHEGDEQLAAIDLGIVRAVQWTNTHANPGVRLEGIATFPAGYVEGKKYPFLVLPHGGPEANDTLALDSLSRTIAGLGYVVLQPEYRGSTGYGEEFLDSIYQHFGDRAYDDVNSATDYAIAQGWADPARLAIFGWSAGGFMTSWTVTQTGRYKAAIEGAGITDWGSFMWTSDVQQIDFDARWPAEDPEAFRRFSAVDFAAKVTTPLLILHGAADQRVPTYQGREYYEVLAARGKIVRMVEYPGAPHFPALWEQRLNVAHELADWLEKYNK